MAFRLKFSVPSCNSHRRAHNKLCCGGRKRAARCHPHRFRDRATRAGSRYGARDPEEAISMLTVIHRHLFQALQQAGIRPDLSGFVWRLSGANSCLICTIDEFEVCRNEQFSCHCHLPLSARGASKRHGARSSRHSRPEASRLPVRRHRLLVGIHLQEDTPSLDGGLVEGIHGLVLGDRDHQAGSIEGSERDPLKPGTVSTESPEGAHEDTSESAPDCPGWGGSVL